MTGWSAFQEQVSDWALHNFGLQGAYQPMLGVIEEVGEFYAAYEMQQGKERNEAQKDAIADQVIYALNLAQICGIQLGHVLHNATSHPFGERELLGGLALCSRAVLKHDQGIRGFDDAKRQVTMETGLRVWASWAKDASIRVCSANDLVRDIDVLYSISRDVWDRIVSKRDWRKNPQTAQTT